jgi:hypothetical protein
VTFPQSDVDRPRATGQAGPPALGHRTDRRAARLIALLGDAEFCRDAVEVLDRLWQRWDPSALPSRTEFDAVLPDFSELHVRPFIKKWGALPPPFRELVAPDLPLKTFDMMVSGRFGVILVLPWTSQPQVLAAHRRIQQLIGRQHSDRQNTRRVQITIWLNDQDVPIAEVIRSLWRSGQSPRRRHAARGIVTIEEEQNLMRLFMRQGLDYREAETRFRQRVRNTRTKKAATVRMALSRYTKDRQTLNRGIQEFAEIDAVSFGVAGLLRATLETDDAKRIQALAVAARNAFVQRAGRGNHITQDH